jgi:hypothetical protein
MQNITEWDFEMAKINFFLSTASLLMLLGKLRIAENENEFVGGWKGLVGTRDEGECRN